jgi:undecaprenyl-diphosphatase
VNDVTRARRTLVGSLLVFGTTTALARRSAPPRAEISCFDAVNTLPEPLHVAVWPVMQLGALAAVPAIAAALELSHHRALARRALASGTATWLLAKGVKRVIRRPRPAVLDPGVRIRGPAASGEGFVSGHAGVAAALAASALPALPGWGVGLAVLATTVGASRLYVGAHLPLDVVGGAALGLAVHSAVVLARP